MHSMIPLLAILLIIAAAQPLSCTAFSSKSTNTNSRGVIQEPNRRDALQHLIFSTMAFTTFAPPPSHALFGGNSQGTNKVTVATDIMGSQIVAQEFLSKNKPESRTMVQGLKGDPTYLLVTFSGDLESFALNAECTHLGCVVPWDDTVNKFVCPCHGSQYDKLGQVLRGPAPGNLKLAKVSIGDEERDEGKYKGKVLLENWIENDFRTNEKPWWV